MFGQLVQLLFINVKLQQLILPELPHKPEVTLQSTSQVACLAYNPKEPHMVAGGLHNGQVVLWDTKSGGLPFESSDSMKSHRDTANCLVWIQSKTGNELFTSARDGQVD